MAASGWSFRSWRSDTSRRPPRRRLSGRRAAFWWLRDAIEGRFLRQLRVGADFHASSAGKLLKYLRTREHRNGKDVGIAWHPPRRPRHFLERAHRLQEHRLEGRENLLVDGPLSTGR